MSKHAQTLQPFSRRQTDLQQNDWLLNSPVESVGDDAVVHELPSPPKLDGDVELQNEMNALTEQLTM